MTKGKLIIEVYEYEIESYIAPAVFEYAADASQVRAFEYIPCDLDTCLVHGNKASLKEILQKAFDTLPRKNQDTEKRREILQLIEEADFGKICVVYNPPQPGSDASVELTNVVPESISRGDARQSRDGAKSRDDMIVYDSQAPVNDLYPISRYRLGTGTQSTVLKEAQRLTIIFFSAAETENTADDPYEDENEAPREIHLILTYLQ